jgi:hypothetical protein
VAAQNTAPPERFCSAGTTKLPSHRERESGSGTGSSISGALRHAAVRPVPGHNRADCRGAGGGRGAGGEVTSPVLDQLPVARTQEPAQHRRQIASGSPCPAPRMRDCNAHVHKSPRAGAGLPMSDGCVRRLGRSLVTSGKVGRPSHTRELWAMGWTF